ncbi:MAG: hypothetical protein LCH83_04460 [Proteobacteria bacterium]|nr:hypothetical protein [Pseudomonadota bacterium]
MSHYFLVLLHHFGIDMGVLEAIAGLIIGLYAIYCGLGLWMAQHVMAVERGEEALVDEDGQTILDQLPSAHIEMMKHYYNGIPGIIWRFAFLCLVASIGCLIMNMQYAVHLFAIALGLDCLLFLTYEKKEQFLSQTSYVERLFDGVQYIALLAALVILVWRKIHLA